MRRLFDPAIVVAVVTSLTTLVVTWLQTHSMNQDLKDSYLATSNAVNHLQREVSRLEGRLDVTVVVSNTDAGEALPATLEMALQHQRSK